MYRAVALLWKDDKFQLKRKLPRERGIWCLLQHKLCNSKIWVASFHLPHNQSLLECERQFQEFVSLPPRNLQACVIMSDFNVPFQWRRCGGEIKPGTSNANWAMLRDTAMQLGLTQVVPRDDQLSAPTFVPRKVGASSTQIDGVFAGVLRREDWTSCRGTARSLAPIMNRYGCSVSSEGPPGRRIVRVRAEVLVAFLFLFPAAPCSFC